MTQQLYYRKTVNLRTQFWKHKFWQSSVLQRIILIVNYIHKYNIFIWKTINYSCVNQDSIFVPSGFMLRFYAIHADVGKGSYASWVTPKTVMCRSVCWTSPTLSFGIFFSPVVLIAVHTCNEEFLKTFYIGRVANSMCTVPPCSSTEMPVWWGNRASRDF